jgi:hypothetical protein
MPISDLLDGQMAGRRRPIGGSYWLSNSRKTMNILKLFGVAFVALFALLGTSYAGSGATQVVNVNHPFPPAITLRVGERLQVITDDDAPGGAAILGARCLGVVAPPVHALSQKSFGPQEFAADQPGSCTLHITYSHFPPDAKFTKQIDIPVSVIP